MKKLVFVILIIMTLSHCFAQEYKEDPIVFREGVYEYTELGKACYDGDFNEVKLLIDKGLNPQQCVNDGFIFFDLIWISISRENFDMMQKLVDYGVQPIAIYSENGLNALSRAIWVNDKEISYRMVEFLLDKGLNVNGINYKDGSDKYIDNIIHPVIEAIYKDNLKVVELLMSRGADLSPADGISALDIARNNNRKEIEELIINKTIK